MITEEITIQNKLGLHARPAAVFVQEASKFECEVKVSKDSTTVNGKSVMGMMMLAAEHGSVIKLTLNGADETQALSALRKLFENKFDEE